jgi:nitroreductase
MTTTSRDTDVRMLRGCVRAASLSPSLHNSQPWRFRITGTAVEVFVDRERQLHELDPLGREMLISVGAAVFTLRLAIRREGWMPSLSLFPESGEPELVARIQLARRSPPPAGVRALADAIAERHTHRHPLASAVVPADAIEQITKAASDEGATLTIAGAVSRDAILGLGRVAEQRLRARGAYRAELGRWTRPTPHRRDGIPSAAIGPWDAMERMPMRDFGLMQPQVWRTAERFETHPTIAVLATHGDGRLEWVRAGQALQRVLLVATCLHLATTPISQPVEVPAVRAMLTRTDADQWAQMVVRLGYGTPAPASPRRPLAEILEGEPPV